MKIQVMRRSVDTWCWRLVGDRGRVLAYSVMVQEHTKAVRAAFDVASRMGCVVEEQDDKVGWRVLAPATATDGSCRRPLNIQGAW